MATPLNKMKQDEFEALVASKGKEAVKWLIEQYTKTEEIPVYPKGEDGKADKTQEPTMKARPKSFISIKSEFAAKFMPELAPKAKSKTDNRDARVKALEELLKTL